MKPLNNYLDAGMSRNSSQANKDSGLGNQQITLGGSHVRNQTYMNPTLEDLEVITQVNLPKSPQNVHNMEPDIMSPQNLRTLKTGIINRDCLSQNQINPMNRQSIDSMKQNLNNFRGNGNFCESPQESVKQNGKIQNVHNLDNSVGTFDSTQSNGNQPFGRGRADSFLQVKQGLQINKSRETLNSTTLDNALSNMQSSTGKMKPGTVVAQNFHIAIQDNVNANPLLGFQMKIREAPTLSNVHNEQNLKQRLKGMFANKVVANLLPNSDIEIDGGAAGSCDRHACGHDTPKAIKVAHTHGPVIEKKNLHDHFDMEKALTLKCRLCISYKLGDQRFVAKRLPANLLELQEYENTILGIRSLHTFPPYNISLMDPWIKMPPLIPNQSYVPSIGIIKDNNGDLFVLSELITDYTLTQSQTNKYEFKKKEIVSKNRLVLSRQNTTMSAYWQRVAGAHSDPLLMMMDQKNLEIRTTGSNEAEMIRSSLTRKNVLNPKKLQKLKQGKTVEVSPKRRDAVLGTLSTEEEEDMLGKKYQQTFYGKRLGIKDLKVSKNYYTVIKSLKLGNLSALVRIPEFYAKNLIQFIVDVSGSMAHAHKHDLIHGHFNLSRVIAQKIKLEDEVVQHIIEKRKKLNKKHADELDFRRIQSNFQFYVTSFEPYRVTEAIMKQNQEPNNKFQKVTNIRQMKLDHQTMLQLYKIKDLHKFANAIVEIMIGRCEEINTGHESSKNGMEIALDSIPLNWGKIPEIQYILQIIQLCYGPYNTHNNIRTNTSKILKEIHKIASETFHRNYIDPEGCTEESVPVDMDRLKSVSYNNMAVSKCLSLTSDSSNSQRQKVQIEMGELLDQALSICPDNQIALLNQGLLGWSCGELRDDEFQNLIKYRMKEIDPEMAQLFFTLFKRDVVGGKIQDHEISAVINELEKKTRIISNVANQLFHHPHFAIYKKEKHNLRLCEDQVIFMNNFLDDIYQYNHVIKLGKIGFSVKGMFFSNNDKFLMIFGSLQVMVIEVKTGQKIYEQSLPKTSRITHRDNFHEKPLTNANAGRSRIGDASMASVSSTTEINNLQTQGNSRRNSATFTIAEDRETSNDRTTQFNEPETQKGDESPDDYTPKDEFGPAHQLTEIMNDIILQKFKELVDEKHLQHPNQIKCSQKDVETEFKKAFEFYPMDWVGQVSDNGKSIALFDKAQQQRNQFCKFQQNRQEFMFINSNIQVKASFDSPSLYKVDLMYFLDNNEVLEFEFSDNASSSNENLIYIHAKNLKTYIIDFVLNMLVEVIVENQSYMLKSIFRTKIGHEQSYAQHEELKEKIQQWEANGVEVRLPKFNQEFIVLQAKDTVQMSIYCLKQNKIIRNFFLNKHEIQYQDKEKPDESKTQSDDEEQQLIQQKYKQALLECEIEQRLGNRLHKTFHMEEEHNHKTIQNHLTWMKVNVMTAIDKEPTTPAAFEMSKIRSTIGNQKMIGRVMSNNVAEMILRKPKLEHEKIKIFEVSSHGRILAAQVGAEVFIKVLNQARRDQCCNSINYHQSITFMPIYRDYDYNTKGIIKKYAEEAEAKRVQELSQSSDYDSMESDHEDVFELNAKTLDTYTRLYELLTGSKKNQMTIVTRQEKIHELYPLVEHVIKNPLAIWKMKVRKRNYLKNVLMVFEILRGFQRIDPKSISISKFNKLNYLFTRKQFGLKRSFEYIKHIICTSNPSRQLLGVLINRKLKVYDFIADQFFFEINIPNLDEIVLSKKSKNTLFFFDNDRIICAQDGSQRVAIVSVALQIELQRSTSTKQPTETITYQLDSCQNGQDMIDMGFGYIGTKKYQAQNDVKDEGDENSDGALQDIEGHCYIDFGEEILNMFYSRHDAACSYLAILGNQKIEIYFIQDDEQGCETNLEWRIECKFDKETRALGKITSLDFGASSLSFATGSNIGNVGIWNITDKHLEWTIKIRHPKTKSRENISMIRALHREQVIITYSLKSQSLLLTQDQKQQSRIKRPVTTQLAFDPSVKGDLKDLAIDPCTTWIAATFENGSVTLYNRLLLVSVYELAPRYGNPRDLSSQLVMDQFFSYVAYVGEDKKQVHFETFEWQFHLAKLEKHIYEEKVKEQEASSAPIGRTQSIKEIHEAATQGFRDFFSTRMNTKREIGKDPYSGQCTSSTCSIF